MKKYLIFTLALLLSCSVIDADAQSFLKKVGQSIEKGVEKGINQLKNAKPSKPATPEQGQKQPQQQVQAQPNEQQAQSQPTSNVKSLVPTAGQSQAKITSSGKLNNHEWVDLGLPSGTRWATCNIDATSPSQPGRHYAWGEIATKGSYVAENSKYNKKDVDDFSGNKSCDVAAAKWGNGWRMPTKAEFDELLHYCNWRYVQKDGRWGALISSTVNDKSIFLPATGYKDGTSTHEASGCGMYWTSTPLKNQYNSGAHEYHFGGGLGEMGVGERSYGYAVRAVVDNKDMVNTPSQGETNGHKWVDLGLPSGTKWATCNVGATSSEHHGEYYAWAEITPILDKTSPKNGVRGKWMSGIATSATYDVATAQWGEGWRMPSKADFQELLDNCTWEWTYLGRIKGCKVTSKINGNYIFLPAAGVIYPNSTYPYPDDLGNVGRYWASTPSNDSHNINADGILCTQKFVGHGTQDRRNGFPIRPVVK